MYCSSPYPEDVYSTRALSDVMTIVPVALLYIFYASYFRRNGYTIVILKETRFCPRTISYLTFVPAHCIAYRQLLLYIRTACDKRKNSV